MGGDKLYRMAAAGGEPKEVLSNIGSKVALSPDGASFAFVRNFPALEETAVMIASADGTEVRKLIARKHPDLFRGIGPAWSPDGKALAYVATIDGISNVWSLPVDGRPPKQLTDFKSDQIFAFDWSRDGKQLACSRGVIANDVILISNFR